jgi:hypothetical protein
VIYPYAVDHLLVRCTASTGPIYAGSWIEVSEKTSSRQFVNRGNGSP